MKLKNKRLIIILGLLVAAMALTWASLWQQEIILIDTFIGERNPFNFMGFGDQNLEWYSWRDIMYVWIIIGNILFTLTGYYIGKGRKKK